MRSRASRIQKSSKTARAVLWLLFLFWPAAVLGWGLVLTVCGIALWLSSSVAWALIAAAFTPLCLWAGIFMVTGMAMHK